MEDNKYMYDLLAALSERTIKRLWILCIIIFIILVGSNVAWLYYESQFTDEVTTTQEVTQENENGSNNFIGNDENITNGYAENKDDNN